MTISRHNNKLLKIISALVALIFLVNSCCYGLATLPASQNPLVKREISAVLQRTQVRYAESPEAIELLKANNASCLLLSSGKYLVTKDVADNDLKLLRGVIHEDIEAIMQILAKDNQSKYQGIKRLILKHFPPSKENNLPIDLYVNHTIARAFEWLCLLEDKIIFEDEIPQEEKDFIGKIRKIINNNRHNYFTSEFRNSSLRGKKIRTALNDGIRFYQVANVQGETFDHEIPLSELQFKPHENPNDKGVYTVPASWWNNKKAKLARDVQGVNIIDLWQDTISRALNTDDIVLTVVGSSSRLPQLGAKYWRCVNDIDVDIFIPEVKMSEQDIARVKDTFRKLARERGIDFSKIPDTKLFGPDGIFDFYIKTFHDWQAERADYFDNYRYTNDYYGTEKGLRRLNEAIAQIDVARYIELYVQFLTKNLNKVDIKYLKQLAIIALSIGKKDLAESCAERYAQLLDLETRGMLSQDQLENEISRFRQSLPQDETAIRNAIANAVRKRCHSTSDVKVITIPDFSSLSFKDIVDQAIPVAEYYEKNQHDRKTIMKFEYSERVDYYVNCGLVILTKKDALDDYRIIKNTAIYAPTGTYEGKLLIYYNSRENTIAIILEGPNADKIITVESDKTRGEMGWDKAEIKVHLNADFGVLKIDHKLTEMGLSRTAICMMLNDAGVPTELRDLYNVLANFLVFPKINDEVRIHEANDNKLVPLTIVSRVNEAPQRASDEDIMALEGFASYKSWTVRELAINALRKAAKEGKITGERLQETENLFKLFHIQEDLLFIERLLIQDPSLISEIFYNLFGEKIKKDEIDKVIVGWYNQGKNKNVYKLQFILKDGRAFYLASSTIRHDPIGLGFSAESIEDAQRNWKRLSNANSRHVPRFGVYRWALDYRPRVTGSSIAGRRESDDPENIGKNRWIYNNISVVFREFIEGKDLAEVLSSVLPGAKKKEMIKVGLQACLDIWNDTKDETQKGLFVGDPRPANIVVYEEDGHYRGKNIDLDALREFNGFEAVKSMIRQYPEYDDFDIVYVNGRAEVITKEGKVDEKIEEINYGDFNELIIVPGHAIYKGEKKEDIFDDSVGWFGGFPGEGKFYAEHVEAGVKLASERPKALLAFSGGITRRGIEKSEAGGYRDLAEQWDWWGNSEVNKRVILEDGARDSLENVLFSVLLFRQYTGRFPDKVTVIGWEFKTERFQLHAQVLGIPLEIFSYIGVNNPSAGELEGALKGERKKIEATRQDMLLKGPDWEAQRTKRDPYNKKARLRYFGDRTIDEISQEITAQYVGEFIIDGIPLFPLISPTAVTHETNDPEGLCIRLLPPEIASDLVIKSRTQVIIFLPGDIKEVKHLLTVQSAEKILASASFPDKAGIYTLGEKGDLASIPEYLRMPYIELAHAKLAAVKETRSFMAWLNTSKALTADDAILLAAFGVRYAALPYLKIEIRDENLMTKNDEVVSCIDRLVKLNDKVKIAPLVGKGITRQMLEDILSHRQVLALRIEGTRPGSNAGLGTELEVKQIQNVIRWAREIRPGIQLIAECGIGTPEHAKEALDMGFNACLVNAAISQSEDPVGTAVKFRDAIEEKIKKPKTTDAGLTKVLFFDYLHNALNQDRTYEIKYDTSRLSQSQIEIIEEYVRLLQARSSNPGNIKLKPFSSVQGAKESLIAVYCTGKDFKGEGHVDVEIPKGTIEEYLLRITGMVNIALAASSIPDNAKEEELKTTYGSIIGFIKSQYKAILGVDLMLPDSVESLLKVIRYITLILPKAHKLPLEEIEEYNRLAQKALIAA